MIFEDLPRPMRYIKPIDNELLDGWVGVCLGDIPNGFRELTNEEFENWYFSK